MSEPLLAVTGLVKDYRGLRPLRIRELSIAPGDIVSITGLDESAAEIFVSLVTGAGLPDAGVVSLFGQPTADILDTAAWLQALERLGLVSARAVLVEPFSARQNIAMPYTLEVDPIDPAVAPRVDALTREVGLDAGVSDAPVGQIASEAKVRVRLARALALDPALLLAEHPTAGLDPDAAAAFGADLARIAAARRVAVIALTADGAFAGALGGRTLTLRPATGDLTSGGIFSRLARKIMSKSEVRSQKLEVRS